MNSPAFGALRRILALASRAERQGLDAAEVVERARDEESRSRRRFLREAAGTAAAAALPGLAARAARADAAGTLAAETRVAIVGAGLAGLHCAWRLREAGIRATVYEASSRVGGRMLTRRNQFKGDYTIELGGEFVDTNHESMRALTRELGIAMDEMNAQSWTYHLRGEKVAEAELVERFKPLAKQICSDATEAEKTFKGYYGFDNLTIAQWLELAGADSLVTRMLDTGYTSEFGLDLDRQSCLNLLETLECHDALRPLNIFGESSVQLRIRAGNDALPTKLAAAMPEQIETGMRLASLSQAAAGTYRLGFARDGATVTREADVVVLAIPFTLLRHVELGLALPDDKRRAIADLDYGTNAKLIGGFESRPWRSRYGSGGDVLADGSLQLLWESTGAVRDEHSGALTSFLGGADGVRLGLDTAAAQWRKTLGQIDAIFPGTRDAASPGPALRMHWPSAPYAKGSYACLKTGQRRLTATVGKRVGNLHFCGEHCSVDFQGYMEGACETGALVSAQILEDLKLRKPAALLSVLGDKLALPQAGYRYAGVDPRFRRRRRQLLAARRRSPAAAIA